MPVYNIFMAIADKVGNDKRGNTIYRITPEGEIILEEVEKEMPTRFEIRKGLG